MKTILTSVTALFVICHSSFVIAQGSLTPPGAPAPTMKTLDQVEARTPISSAPFNISASGSYYLTGNLTVATGNAITINADQVTLDLNGFTISSTASPASGTAVLLNSARKNVTIKNGHISGTTTFSAGAFTTGGFLDGVVNGSNSSANIHVTDLNILGMGSDGIVLNGSGVPTYVVERCNITVCAGVEIQAFVIRDCTADTVGGSAIAGDMVTNCYGETVSTLAALVSAVPRMWRTAVVFRPAQPGWLAAMSATAGEAARRASAWLRPMR